VYIIIFYEDLHKMKDRIKKAKIIWICGCVFCLLVMQAACTSQQKIQKPPTLTVFAGSASQPVLKEIARVYTHKTGIRIELVFGSSGYLLNQMQLTGKGDVYIPGSMDYMLKAERLGTINPATIRRLAYLVPAINVKPGNPKNIKGLSDLARPGMRIGIARPENVCVGLYAIEVLKANKLLRAVMPNLLVTTESCAKTASAIALTDIDAVIGWREFEKWAPKHIETVLIPPTEKVPRLGVIPAAVATSTKDMETAKSFIAFLCEQESRSIFRHFKYITDESDARQLAPHAKIGGEYQLPSDWRTGPES
jgi:molybdate transport system substrate-binding protein